MPASCRNNPDMIALLILLGSSVVGKIYGQETVASLIINTRSARISPVERRPTAVQDTSRLESSPPTRIIEILVQPTEVEFYQPRLINGGSSFNLPHSTVKSNQPQRTQQKITERMEGTNNSDGARADNKSTAGERSKSMDKDMENNKEKTTAKPVRPDSLPLPSPNAGNTTSGSILKPTVAKAMPPTNVTLDERSSFTGDECPKGFVKLNGKCIPIDD